MECKNCVQKDPPLWYSQREAGAAPACWDRDTARTSLWRSGASIPASVLSRAGENSTPESPNIPE